MLASTYSTPGENALFMVSSVLTLELYQFGVTGGQALLCGFPVSGD